MAKNICTRCGQLSTVSKNIDHYEGICLECYKDYKEAN